jgi:hypothetical protein
MTLAAVIATLAIAAAAVTTSTFEVVPALVFALPMLAIAAMCFGFLLPFPHSSYVYRSGKWGLAICAMILVASALISI